MNDICTVSIIGRPNVGKSSLFNRLLKKSPKALTFDTPGVTRDRNYAVIGSRQLESDEDLTAVLVDTGGFYPDNTLGADKSSEFDKKSKDLFFHLMRDHAKIAIGESDLVLMVVDVREGLNPFDREIYHFLRTQKIPFYLVINKYDSDKQEMDVFPFYELAHEEDKTFTISASHGLGIESLRENIKNFILSFDSNRASSFAKGVVPEHKVVGNLSIVGAPNAGKSTLLNLLTKSERSLVSPIAGTTVDPIEGYLTIDFKDKADSLDLSSSRIKTNEIIGMEYEKFLESLESGESLEGDTDSEDEVECDENDISDETVNGIRSIKVVDTAGIRKKSHINEFVEEQSVYRSLRAISESDVVIYLMDAQKGLTHHDRRLIDISFEKGKSVILVFNKFDLMKKDIRTDHQLREWIKDVRDEAPWLDFCEIITMSALTGENLIKLLAAVRRTFITRSRKVSTSKLNFVVSSLVDKNPIYVKGSRGKHFKIKYTSMLKSNPPTFLLFSNRSKNIPENYKRYLKKGLRNHLGFKNTPLHLIFRTGKDLELREKKISPTSSPRN